MNYTLHQLQVFLKVTQTLSVTKAAVELNLTQPAVSIQLKNFQDQFDIPLVEIVGRKVYITDFGKEIAKSAQNIIDQVSTINFKTHTYKGQLSGRLKISVVSTGKYILPYFLSPFIKTNPGVELIIDVTNKMQVAETLQNNEVDFSLVSIPPNAINIDKLDLLQNKMYLVGSNEHKFRKSVYTKDIFRQLPLIYREKGSGMREIMERFIESHRIHVIKKMELNSNEAVKQAVIAGLGYSVMPLIGIKNELYTGDLQIIAVKGLPIKTVWRLIWLKGKKHSPVAESFLTFMRKEKDQIIKSRFDWYEQY